MRKPDFEVSDQVRLKPNCATIDDGEVLGVADLGSKGTVLSM